MHWTRASHAFQLQLLSFRSINENKTETKNQINMENNGNDQFAWLASINVVAASALNAVSPLEWMIRPMKMAKLAHVISMQPFILLIYNGIV